MNVILKPCISIRFPFISSEVLTCEIDVILKTLVEEEEVLYYFSSFFVMMDWMQKLVVFSCKFEFGVPFSLVPFNCFTLLMQLMDLLFSFLEPNRSHSVMLAGYFSKVRFSMYTFFSSYFENFNSY